MANVVYTNSIQEAIHRYNLSKDIIYHVVNNADRKLPGNQPGSTLFQKQTASGLVSVVGRNKGNDILAITCWVKQSNQHYKAPEDSRYKNASFLKKIWLDILTTFGM